MVIYLNLSEAEFIDLKHKYRPFLQKIYDSKTKLQRHRILGSGHILELQFLLYILHLNANGSIPMYHKLWEKLIQSRLKKRLLNIKRQKDYLKVASRPKGSYARSRYMAYLEKLQIVLPLFIAPFFDPEVYN